MIGAKEPPRATEPPSATHTGERAGATTHVSLTMTSRGKGPHRLGSLVLHYEGGSDG